MGGGIAQDPGLSAGRAICEAILPRRVPLAWAGFREAVPEHISLGRPGHADHGGAEEGLPMIHQEAVVWGASQGPPACANQSANRRVTGI